VKSEIAFSRASSGKSSLTDKVASLDPIGAPKRMATGGHGGER